MAAKIDNQLQQMIDFTDPIRTEMCHNERKFMPIAQRKVELKDGNYQTSLPFQDRQAPEPTNKAQAWQGAIWLRKKLERDPK